MVGIDVDLAKGVPKNNDKRQATKILALISLALCRCLPFVV